jgi:glutathione S-transferase
MRASPTGKLPYIKVGEKVISDSTLIIDYLKTEQGDVLDRSLTANQRADSWALQVMLEEHLYWIIVYSRWVDPSGWAIAKKDFFGSLPKVLQWFVPMIVRRKIKKALYVQGLGRHSREVIYALGKKDLLTIAAYLYAQPFVFGEEPTSIDACVYAFLASILFAPIPSPLKQYAEQLPELLAYCERMKKWLFTNALVN